MLESIILTVSYILVFYHKGILFGLGFLVVSWLIIGNIIKAICKEEKSGFFLFAIVVGVLSYFCSYIL